APQTLQVRSISLLQRTRKQKTERLFERRWQKEVARPGYLRQASPKPPAEINHGKWPEIRQSYPKASRRFLAGSILIVRWQERCMYSYARISPESSSGASVQTRRD